MKANLKNTKNIIIGILALILVSLAYKLSGLDMKNLINKVYKSKDNKVEITEIKKEDISYIDENASSSREIIWEAFGFEPGFAMKVFSENEKGKIIYSTNIVTQEADVYSGFINSINIVNLTKFTGEILNTVNNIKVKVEMNFENKKCIEPSGDDSEYILSLKIGNETLIGCAEKIQGKI